MKGIADYTFVRPLGGGNHGEFYLAHTPPRLPVSTEYVAVKVLIGESTTDMFRRATRELAAFAAVSSPYLVRLYDAGQQDGVFYYAMEYLTRGSLEVPAEPLDTPTAVRAVAHAAHAAAALHAAGIVHRDIKPGNILLDTYGAKLSDLGLSQVFLPGVTVTGMGPLTSMEYLEPAVLSGEAARPEHDVWALGVTLHRAVTSTSVYTDELPSHDSLLALRRILSSSPVVSPAMPEPLASIVARCFGPAADRPSAADLALLLDQVHPPVKAG